MKEDIGASVSGMLIEYVRVGSYIVMTNSGQRCETLCLTDFIEYPSNNQIIAHIKTSV